MERAWGTANLGIIRRRHTMSHALAGLEAGVLGTVLMVGWLMLGSLWLRRSVWSIPNLFAMVFYGPQAYTNQFHRSTLGGLALMLVIYGALGVVWGVVCGVVLPDKRNSFLPLAGAAAGLAAYALFFDYVWPHTRPFVQLYAPSRQLQLGHMIWGMMLARSPRFARGIAGAVGQAGIRSGEVTL